MKIKSYLGYVKLISCSVFSSNILQKKPHLLMLVSRCSEVLIGVSVNMPEWNFESFVRFKWCYKAPSWKTKVGKYIGEEDGKMNPSRRVLCVSKAPPGVCPVMSAGCNNITVRSLSWLAAAFITECLDSSADGHDITPACRCWQGGNANGAHTARAATWRVNRKSDTSCLF